MWIRANSASVSTTSIRKSLGYAAEEVSRLLVVVAAWNSALSASLSSRMRRMLRRSAGSMPDTQSTPTTVRSAGTSWSFRVVGLFPAVLEVVVAAVGDAHLGHRVPAGRRRAQVAGVQHDLLVDRSERGEAQVADVGRRPPSRASSSRPPSAAANCSSHDIIDQVAPAVVVLARSRSFDACGAPARAYSSGRPKLCPSSWATVSPRTRPLTPGSPSRPAWRTSGSCG